MYSTIKSIQLLTALLKNIISTNWCFLPEAVIYLLFIHLRMTAFLIVILLLMKEAPFTTE